MKFLSFFFMALFIAAPLAQAQVRPGVKTDTQGPISISADFLEAQDQKGEVVFRGSVVARQGDLSITCDLMRAYYTSSSKGASAASKGGATESVQGEEAAANQDGGEGQLDPLNPDVNQQIEKVECEGNVRIVEGDRMAVGQKALYLATALPRRIILTGDARIWQGQDSVTGHQVTYFIEDQRSTVEGRSNERVRATYHNEDQKEGGK